MEGLTAAVRYHGITIDDEKMSSDTDWPPTHMRFVRGGFALRMDYSVVELEHAFVKVVELQKRPDGSDGRALAAGFKIKNN